MSSGDPCALRGVWWPQKPEKLWGEACIHVLHTLADAVLRAGGSPRACGRHPPRGTFSAAEEGTACSSPACGDAGAAPAANKGFLLTFSTKPGNNGPVHFYFPPWGVWDTREIC